GELTGITMRPSDVPTYVEPGAAELGITGKDVLLEQRDRAAYELLDLGYGARRLVLAGRRGDQRLGESERRLAAVRVATKAPPAATRPCGRSPRGSARTCRSRCGWTRRSWRLRRGCSTPRSAGRFAPPLGTSPWWLAPSSNRAARPSPSSREARPWRSARNRLP